MLISAIRDRPALLSLRDRSATYGKCIELTYITRKESEVHGSRVLTDDEFTGLANLRLWFLNQHGSHSWGCYVQTGRQ
jgi:hypothetical protein